MTLQEWKASLGGHGGTAASAPAGAADDGTTPTPYGPMRTATSGDDFTSAAEGELWRTAKEAGIGLARSPIDLVKNLFNTVAHPIDTAAGIAHTVAHPVERAEALMKSPRDAGSALGQLLLSPKVPGAVEGAPGVVGRGVSAVGRGAEALGTSKAIRGMSKLGAVGEVLHGNPGMGIASAVIPPALEYGGQALQKGGAALEGLKLSLKGAKLPPETDPEAATVRETVRTARELKDGGMSSAQAAQRSGWPLGKSSEIPYQAETATPNTDLFPYQKESLQGLRDAAYNKKVDAARYDPSSWTSEYAAKVNDAKWAGDKSADPNGGKGAKFDDATESADELGSLMDAIHGEDNVVQPNGGDLSPLDRLARLSGRGKR